MNINNPSVASIAGQVWNNGVRTLTADPATDAGAATLVWGHAARTITSLNGAVSTGTNRNTALAAGAIQDARPGANVSRTVTFIGLASVLVGLYDGTNFDSSGAVWGTGQGNSTRGTVIKNTTGGGVTVSWAWEDKNIA